MDKILFENNLNETGEPGANMPEPQYEPKAGTDGDSTAAQFAAAARTGTADQTSYATVSNTNTTDIARTEPQVGFAGSIASKTLPAVLGYVQPMNSPAGFVFAMKQDGTSGNVEDLAITRKTVTTGLREVTLDFSDEVVQDINNLFGPQFSKNYKEYLFYDGSDVEFVNPFETTTKTINGSYEQTQDGKLAEFFINFATWRMSRKTNIDFTTWLGTVATDMGAFTIADGTEILNLKAAIGEMKAKVYTDTQKTSRTWVLSDPKTINYLLLSSTTCAPDNKMARKGKRSPNAIDYNYVFTCGETDYYQDINIPVGEIYVGITGGPNESSIYYTPYKEYFIQGGEDYQTGQSNIFFRLRDDWVTNPIDTGTGAADSDFIVKSTVTYTLPNIIS